MARQPRWVEPMKATLTKDYFSDPEWIYEPKLDGIRLLAYKKGEDVRLLSRNKLDLTGRSLRYTLPLPNNGATLSWTAR